MSVSTNLKGLAELGLKPSEVFHNLSYEEIYQHELNNKEGVTSDNGTMMVDTGIFTGRSPKDKYFVDEPSSTNNIWWGPVNTKVSEAIFNELYAEVTKFLDNKNYTYLMAMQEQTTTHVSLSVWSQNVLGNTTFAPTCSSAQRKKNSQNSIQSLQSSMHLVIKTQNTKNMASILKCL